MSSFSLRNFVTPAALSCFLLTAVIGLGLDLWSKHEAFARLAPAGVTQHTDGRVTIDDPGLYRLVPLWVHLTPTANQGAVFGIGQGKRDLFLAVSVAAIAFIFYLFATSGRAWFYQIVLGLLLAGVLGNMYDRVQFGYVRDMILIFPGRFILGHPVFPWIFNVADSMLCVGVFLIFVYSLRGGPRKKPVAEGEQTDAPAAV